MVVCLVMPFSFQHISRYSWKEEESLYVIIGADNEICKCCINQESCTAQKLFSGAT